MRFSASRLKLHMRCSLAAEYRYVHKLPTRQNAKASFGTVIHAALQEYYESRGDLGRAMMKFKGGWAHPERLGVEPDYWPKGTSFGSLMGKGIEILNAVHEKAKWANITLIGTEIPFLVPFGRHELTGFIDLLTIEKSGTGRELMVITDHKSNGKRPLKAELALDVQFCVDADTEALTQRGWLRHTDLTEDDRVLTYNQQLGVAEWQPVLAVHRFETNDQEMMEMTSISHSSVTTLNHRWPVRHTVAGKSGWRNEQRVVTSADLRSNDSIPCAAPVANLPLEPKHTDALVEVMAWTWTEGWFRDGKYVSLSQSETANPGHVDRIKSALRAVFGPEVDKFPRTGRATDATPRWRASHDPDCVRFYLNKVASDVLAPLFADTSEMVVDPAFLTTLTQAQLALFIDVSVWADGHENHGCRVVTQASRRRLDLLQMACSLAGIRSSLRYSPVRSEQHRGREQWRLALKEREPWFRANPERQKRVQYTGTVWCPRTENQTWLARRDGQVYFTGNTTYAYATYQKEFWVGGMDPAFPGLPNGDWLWNTIGQRMDRRMVWHHLYGPTHIDAGPRVTSDFERLYRVCEEVDKAVTAGISVPTIGSSCEWCDFQEPCRLEIPVAINNMQNANDPSRWI